MVYYKVGSNLAQGDTIPEDDCAHQCDKAGCFFYSFLDTYAENNVYPSWSNCIDHNIEQPVSIMDLVRTIQDEDGKNVNDAKSSLIENYDDFKDGYFDFDGGPSYPGVGQVSDGNQMTPIEVTLPRYYRSVSFELMEGFFCSQGESVQLFEQCPGTIVTVAPGYYYRGSCSRTAPRREYCEGKHGCHVKVKYTLNDDDNEDYKP